MKFKNYNYILLFITSTILATISLQIYWNIKNYEENKRRLINDVQLSLDNSIENYYAEEAKNNYTSFVAKNDSIEDPNFINNLIKDTVFKNNLPGKTNKSKSLKKATTKKTFVRELTNKELETTFGTFPNIDIKPSKISSVTVIKGKSAFDSLSKFKDFTNKIIISTFKDSVEFSRIFANLNKELIRKNIEINFGFKLYKNDSVSQTFYSKNKDNLSLSTFSNSIFLPSNQKIKLEFSNPTIEILKRSITEIILSFLLSISIIFCLLYLLKTINRQKKIDVIKNDLISNITHEFKTPITTVSTALEGIKSFNLVNDTEKTSRYIAISNQQLKKLEIMVEKLLETASLETDEIQLKKEFVNITELLKNEVEKYQINANEKEIYFDLKTEDIIANVDGFHFENAVSNIIENAVKYGGNEIVILLDKQKNNIVILVEDNGKGIDKKQRELIFEKFYRIQKGNIHDVKGFGIGLYYSKKIIEKHEGKIELIINSKTSFKITIPND